MPGPDWRAGPQRQEPWVVPSYGKGGIDGLRGARGTFGTVAPLNPVTGPGTLVPLGTGAMAPVAVPVVERNDKPALSRLPASVVRAVWSRFSYVGIHSADVPAPLPGPAASPGPSGTGGIGGQP
jgi:hypothetical protein